MEVSIVPISSIWAGERFREDFGDIGDLVKSIKTYGIIQPLAVNKNLGPDGEVYQLLAGGRRFKAAGLAEIEKIPVRIYPEELGGLQRRSIELEENIRRKDLTFHEDCKLKREIDNLQKEIHGKKVSTAPDASGWSLRDTAKLLGKDHTGVLADIRLADAIDSFPQLEWDKCKTKSDAFKMLNRFEERIVRADLVEKASKVLGKGSKKLTDSFVVGDFFHHVKGIPDRSINLVEIDPPYAIDLPNKKDGHAVTYGTSYNEVDVTNYLAFMKNTLEECYRVMTDDSWLIVWFGPEPWFDPMYHLIISAGFKTRRLCGIWAKPSGQTRQPQIYFGNSFEMFYYARKGNPKINLDKQGRSNIFKYSTVPPGQKVHPTERPVELMEELLNTFAWEGSRILVPFAGSGNTLLAAFNLKMFPLGYDLSSEYREAFVSRIVANNLRKEN